MAIFVSLTQSSFRVRNDDGSESSATWAAALNTNASIQVDTNFRVRFATSVGGSGSGIYTNTGTRSIAYSLNGGTFAQVTSSSSVVKLSSSSHVSDETATTQQITSGGTYQAGNVLTSSSNTTNTNHSNNTIEDEGCFQIVSSAVNNGDTIVIEMVPSTSGFYDGGYSQTCTITVVKAVSRRRVDSNFF